MQPALMLFNLLAMSASLWLGCYIVTRSPGRRESWLAALTLWAIASLFLHKALAPALPAHPLLLWLRPAAVFGLPLWFHLTLLFAPQQGDGLVVLQRWVLAPLAYALTALLVAGQAFPWQIGPPVGPRFLHLLVFVFVVGSLSSVTLWQSRRQTRNPLLRRVFASLLASTAFAYLGGIGLGVCVWLQSRLPSFPELLVFLSNVACGASILHLGYAVARYNAFIEGRTIERDMLYSLLGIGAIATLYGGVALLLYWSGHATFLTLVVFLICALISHSAYEGGRAALDRLFYHDQLQQLRANLRALAREAGDGGENSLGPTFAQRLQTTLAKLCRNLSLVQGFIALLEEDAFVVVASTDAGAGEARSPIQVNQVFPAPSLAVADITDLSGCPQAGLEGMALAVPLKVGSQRIGVLVVGAKVAGRAYTGHDLDLLETLSHQLAMFIHLSRLQAANAATINQMVGDFRTRERELQRQIQQLLATQEQGADPHGANAGEEALVATVERCLQHFHDFWFLGQQPLARWQIVNQHLKAGNGTPVTELDRGRALQHLLLQALLRLRPDGNEPNGCATPSRPWYPFLILYDGYVHNRLTRDILGTLYISEATFHRIRRRAVRTITRTLLEMEQYTRPAGRPDAVSQPSMTVFDSA